MPEDEKKETKMLELLEDCYYFYLHIFLEIDVHL